MNTRALVALLLIVSAVSANADDETDFFQSQVAPLLERHCFECHSHQAVMEGGLTLDSRSGWQTGGDSGPAIIPGKPDESLLMRMVRWDDDDHQMPPDERLSDEAVETLQQWINQGAVDPRVLDDSLPQQPQGWAYQPLTRPLVPHGQNGANPIDHFIQDKLDRASLKASPQTAPASLLRRVYYDLHGLPPDYEAVRAFAADQRPDAYTRVIDSLLASPHYAERWTRHWLDTIHFAETHGCGHDLPREHAWRFRDFVIDAFDRDTPWPNFIQQQLAADHFYPENPQLKAALGFLGAGVFDHSAYTTAPKNFEYLDRDDMVTQTIGAFTSTTVQCARCHAHKFDPISQQDYYALQAVFAGVIEGDVLVDTDPDVAIQRHHWNSLVDAAESRDPTILLAPENARLVADWEATQGPSATWTPLDYQTYVSTHGSELSREGEVLVSSGPKPETDTYIITAAVPGNQLTALRLDVLTHPSLALGGPGRQDNGNLTVSAFESVISAPGSVSGEAVTFNRATADFDQSGWTAAMAIDGNLATGWGIHPAVGQSHHAIFQLSKPLVLNPDSTITVTIKQVSGRSHLIGRFSLSVTDSPQEQITAIPMAVSESLATAPEERTTAQQLALAAFALQATALEHLADMPDQVPVYAAGKRAGVLLNVGKTTATEVKSPRLVHVLKRGDFDKPIGEAISGTLSDVNGLPSRFPEAHAGDESLRRAALAQWLSHHDNVLMWRSITNRVWQYHFGRGLCDTPNDFGRMGGTPSHPELLDWLACELRDSGGSLKHLHRLIMSSDTYRQSSQVRPDAAAIDPDNRLLWRMNRQRLDAESYRDFVLAISQRLDTSTVGGPSVRQFVQGPPVQLTPTLDYEAYDWSSLPRHRRSIYRFVWRGVPDPFMDALDFPDLGALAPNRGYSVSSMQALALYNNRFVLHFSEQLGLQVAEPADAVRRIWGREPAEHELEALHRYTDQHGLPALCRVLFNSNEFVFVH